MAFFLTFLFWAAAAMAFAGILYTSIAAILVRKRSAPARLNESAQPGVTLLKPLHHNETGLEDDLASFFEQDYNGPLQIIFGVTSPSDTALGVAEKLRDRFPHADVTFVVDTRSEGTNPKIANLINMVGHARHEIVIVSDSDISAGRNYVGTLVAELSQSNVGAVTCLYRGKPLRNLWSTLEAMHIDFAFFPNIIFGTTFGLAKPCFGSTIALRQSVLSEIGGFRAISRHLADDYEVGRAVRARGYLVKTSSLIVDHSCTESGVTDLVRHELRWARTIRILDPVGHIGSVVTYPFPLALIAAMIQGFAIPGLPLLGLALAARLWLAQSIRATINSQAGPLWLLPLRDVLSFGIFLASLFGNSVYWRGTRYMTGADGVLAQR